MLSIHAVHTGEDIKQHFRGRLRRVNRLPPELDCDLVWHELAFARVIEEGFTHFRAGIDRAKYIATGAMIEARDRTERFTLRPFAAARRAKEDKRVVPHERNPFILQPRRSRKVESAAIFQQ